MSWHRNLHWHVKPCLSNSQHPAIRSAGAERPRCSISRTAKVDSVKSSLIKGACCFWLCVCVRSIVRICTCCSFIVYFPKIWLQQSRPLRLYDTPEWLILSGKAPGTQKVGDIKKHDEPLRSWTAPLCLVMTHSHVKRKNTTREITHAVQVWIRRTKLWFIWYSGAPKV